MATVSSSTRNASAPAAEAAAPTAVSKQPTYTTAGTIYNPNSSQPLQPPARRGRSNKWNGANIGQPDLVLFPKGILAGLTLKATSSARAAAMPQYAPLQQNSDRAVSPLSGSEHAAVGIALPSQAPRMRSGNVPGQAISAAAKEGKDDKKDAAKAKENMLAAEEHVDLSDNDKQDEAGEDDHATIIRLLGMNVKSISNLASYPNPNQRHAQKILSAGTRASLLGRKPPVSPVAPSGFAPSMELRPDVPAGSVGRRGCGLLRPCQVGVGAKIAHSQTGLLPPAQLPSPPSNGEQAATPSTILFSRPGAPIPLTAGPPGQRQYRRSTFESTLKALHTPPASRSARGFFKDDQDGLDGGRKSPARVGVDHVDGSELDSLPSPFSLGSALSPIRSYLTPSPVAHDEVKLPAASRSLLVQLVETSEPDTGNVGNATLTMATYSDETEWDQALDMSYHSWRHQDGWSRGRYMPNSDRLSARAARVRREKIDSSWYAGSDLLGKWPEEIMAESKFRKLRGLDGVVGDGRPKRNPKTEYRYISVDEANATPASECAKPLLNMALAVLDRAAQPEYLGGAFFEWADGLRAAAEAAEAAEAARDKKAGDEVAGEAGARGD